MKPPTKVVSAFKKADKFLGHVHIGPDEDSIGATLGLKLGLESLGKTVTVFAEDKLLSSSSFLPQVGTIKRARFKEITTQVPHNYYLSLDTAKWPLATHALPTPQPDSPVIVIDHHPDNEIKADIIWLDPSASSTAEMVFYLLDSLKVKPTPDIATCLLYGLMGDTDIFTSANTSPQVLKLAVDLTSTGADYHQCLLHIDRSRRFQDLKVWEHFIKNLQFSPDRSYVWTTLNYSTWQKFPPGTKTGDFADMIIRKVDGTGFGAVLVEKQAGITKGYLRSRLPGVDVAQIARLLGGGGHPASAGFRLEKPLKTAEQEFLSAVKYTQNKKRK